MTRKGGIEDDLEEALWRYLSRLRRERYFGVTELHFHDGRVVRVKAQTVLEPKDLLRLAAESK